ncbi:MAG: glycosyltransferase family 4 protein [Burkholderiaceae bacterium]
MKIAQVAPLFESIPPKAYGGTERVISYLTEELVELGHDVTLFGAGDSVTGARLVAPIGRSIRPVPGDHSWLAYHMIAFERLRRSASEFDLVHFHTDYLHFPLAASLGRPHVSTIHGRVDLPELGPLYREFADVPLISISNHQRLPQPSANWVGTVHHGLPEDLYACSTETGGYFAFVGRISREKRVDRAIEIAERCGMPLIIGAKIDPADEAYFSEVIEPLFRKPHVTYIGEIGQPEKRALLERADALLFPIDWPEPFGLVMIEAFACGTPVVAYPNGAVPEIVEEGVTGFMVTSQDEAVAAASRIGAIDRRACRAAFERRFTARRMANDYLRLYEQRIAACDPHRGRMPARADRIAR